MVHQYVYFSSLKRCISLSISWRTEETDKVSLTRSFICYIFSPKLKRSHVLFLGLQTDRLEVYIVILFSSILWLSLQHDKPKQVNISNPTSNNIALWKLNILLVYLGKLYLIGYRRCRDKFQEFILIRPHIIYLQSCQRGVSWQMNLLCPQ